MLTKWEAIAIATTVSTLIIAAACLDGKSKDAYAQIECKKIELQIAMHSCSGK